MEIIVNQAKLITWVVGEQIIEHNKEYRLLHYCLLHDKTKDRFIYNILTKELIKLEEEEYKIIKNNHFDFREELIIYLIKHWFIVPIEHDDMILCDQLRKTSKMFSDNLHENFDMYNIFTTTACNARCFYCFESKNIKKTMSLDTAKEVANFIEKNSKNIDGKIKIQWFGGEPLCNIQAINTICSSLAEKKIKYASQMISNGYLFDDKIISIAKSNWNLENIQITLDGLEHTYNRVKNYIKAVNNPFERVITNIENLLLKNIFVIVRLNMDEYNYKELYDLVDFLHKKFSRYNNFAIYAKLIYENVGFNAIVHTPQEREKLYSQYLDLCNYIIDCDLYVRSVLKNKIRFTQCMADNMKTLMILPDGKLGRCEHHLDDDFYGTIFTNENKIPWSQYYDVLSSCKTCNVYPECFRLKGCDSIDETCSDYMKYEILSRIENSIPHTYKNYLIQNRVIT